MYDLKSQFDITRFIGATLEQVCFARYGFHLTFSLNDLNSIGLQIEEDTKQPLHKNYLFPNAMESKPALMLINAIQLKIISANIKNENDFVLTFENGFSFVVAAIGNYESYHITADGKTVTI